MLAGFVASLVYKPGWRFKLAGPGTRYLCVFASTPDSLNPLRGRLTQHQFELPDTTDVHELARWVRDRLLEIERHECCEFLQIAGERPFFPVHNTDVASPYADVEHWEAPC